MKRIKNKVRNVLKFFLIAIAVFSILNVSAMAIFGEGSNCLNIGINDGYHYDPDHPEENNPGFPISSVTVNNSENIWDSALHRLNDTYEFRTDDNDYEIVILVGKNGDDFPDYSRPGGFDDYGTIERIPNPDDDQDVIGDEYKITIRLDDFPYNGHNDSCSFYGIDIVSGFDPENEPGEVDALISISISGEELEYHYVADKPDEADVARFKFGINNPIYENNVFHGTSSNGLVDFTFGNATFKNGIMPPNAIGVSTTNDIEYTYGYDRSGTVSFCINGGSDDNYTKIQISGKSNNQSHDYTSQAPHSQIEVYEHIIGRASQFCIDGVPYDEVGYDVVVEGERQPEANLVAGFGWSYLNENDEEGDFAHGRLEFVSASYTDIDNVTHEFESARDYNTTKYHGTGEIYEWNDGRKDYSEEDRREAWGSALVPNGTALTVRIVPDEGYQLVGLTNNTSFTATDTPGVYTIVVSSENLYNADAERFHLGAVFEEVGGTVIADATNVSQGTIDIPNGQDAFTTGTPKLEVTDVVSMSPEREGNFNEAAEDEGYVIDNYLEIALYNAIFKGGKKDNNDNYLSWDTEVSSLANDAKATVTLQLEDDVAESIEGKEIVIIHEEHDEDRIVGYDVIDAVYDENNKTLSFETGSFSTFAIATKGGDPETHTVTFKEEDDTEINHVEIAHGDYVEIPQEPPKPNDNAHFEGWYTDRSFQEEFDFEHTQIMDDTSIYALWSYPDNSETFDVRFDSLGGDPVDDQHVASGEYATEPNPAPTKQGYTLEGWYLDDEFLHKFDFANTKITDHVDLIAHWVRDIENPANYSIEDDNGNKIEFTEEAGNTYTLMIVNFLDFSKEEAMTLANLTEEEYDNYVERTCEAVQASGTLIGIIGISVVDNNTNQEITDGPLTVKIKLKDEMKQYNTLKLIYVDDNDNFRTQTPITLTVEGDYAVGTLKHLSFYALAATNETSTSSNPGTGDRIYIWFGIMGLSVIGLSYGALKYHKNKKSM